MRRIAPFLILASVTPATLTTQSYRTDAPPTVAVGFGTSVAIAGGQVLVGRAGVVPGFPMPPAQNGAIHLFRRAAEGWSEVGGVSARDAAVGDGFGSTLVVEGKLMAVGAASRHRNKEGDTGGSESVGCGHGSSFGVVALEPLWSRVTISSARW